jgi:hypothetical protein
LRLPLLVSVGGRQLGAEFLVPHLSQLHNPVGKGVETLLDQNPCKAQPAQIGADTDRPLAAGRVVGHEILRVAPVIEQFFAAQRLEQRRDDCCIVTFIEEFTA